VQNSEFWSQCQKSQRLKPGRGKKAKWVASNGETVTLPVIVELEWHHQPTGKLAFRVTGEVALLDNEPRLLRVETSSPVGLVPTMLQSAFRWQTPLDVVKVLVPRLLKAGFDPYNFPLPTDGYPDAALNLRPDNKSRLTDKFLSEVVDEYLRGGRGYAKRLAEHHGVSERTAVSWIEKARQRNFLPKTAPDSDVGKIIRTAKAKATTTAKAR